MVRLLGVNLPDDKRVEYTLTMIYGIGWTAAGKVLKEAAVDKNKKTGTLSEEELKKIISVIDKNYRVEGELREEINENLKRLREIGSYRGSRHAKGLPVYGQRTRSNARTKRGKRKTVGALKKEVWAKMTQGGAAAGAGEEGKAGGETAAKGSAKK
jgi:small subunit ribosomal protein S13